MAHDPKIVANWLIQRGIDEGKPLTHIEVQKLLYFAHGWALAIHGEPLHEGTWEAWQYGPVLPDLYFTLNYNRGQPIDQIIPVRGEPLTNDESTILDAVYRYRSLGTFTLVGVSHSRGGPWDRVWHSGVSSKGIDNDLIEHYFRDLLRKNENANG